MAKREWPRDTRETVIRIDHDEGIVEVWTMMRGLINKLRKLGFEELSAQGRGVWYKGTKRQISFRNKAKKGGSRRTKGLPGVVLGAAAKSEERPTDGGLAIEAPEEGMGGAHGGEGRGQLS